MDIFLVARNILGVAADVCTVYLVVERVSAWLKGQL